MKFVEIEIVLFKEDENEENLKKINWEFSHLKVIYCLSRLYMFSSF